MKEGDNKRTALHFASYNGHEDIVKLLLKAFSEKEKDKLIEYVMKEGYEKSTALHFASSKGYEGIVKLLLNTFSENEKDKLIEYVTKVNLENRSALYMTSRNKHARIVELLKMPGNLLVVPSLRVGTPIFQKLELTDFEVT